jgi:hypothetical protein
MLILDQILEITPENFYHLVDMFKVGYNGQLIFADDPKPERMTRKGDEIFLGEIPIGWIAIIPLTHLSSRVAIEANSNYPINEMENLRNFVLDFLRKEKGQASKKKMQERRERINQLRAEDPAISVDQLASKLGVSEKTIDRDLKVIRNNLDK